MKRRNDSKKTLTEHHVRVLEVAMNRAAARTHNFAWKDGGRLAVKYKPRVMCGRAGRCNPHHTCTVTIRMYVNCESTRLALTLHGGTGEDHE
jgi:hypothetical protein